MRKFRYLLNGENKLNVHMVMIISVCSRPTGLLAFVLSQLTWPTVRKKTCCSRFLVWFVLLDLSVYVYICWSLFVLLYFFFWPLWYLSYFDIRILITPLVSSNSSWEHYHGICSSPLRRCLSINYTFHSLWFDLTRVRARDLQHWRRTHYFFYFF